MLAVIAVGLAMGGLAHTIGHGQPRRSEGRPPTPRRPWATAVRCATADLPPAAPTLPARMSSPALPGSIAVLDHLGERVLVMSGEIDVGTVQAFEACSGSSAPAPVPTVSVAVADVRAVTFIDSCGLLFLLRCTEAARASGRRPILLGPTPPVQRVLLLTGLTGMFDTDPPRR